ncbi:MAG: rod shape-determining protein MreC [Flavobacteriales bacterium]|jgi:rod shape-determining protein MreC
MRNILNLIQRYYVFLLFLTLQGFALYVFFNNNNYAKAEFINHSRDWVGSIYSKRTQLKEYLMLGEINDRLSLENAILRSKLPENVMVVDTASFEMRDTLAFQRYVYRNAKVENITLNRERNYIMLNRGIIGGIEPEMGVISNGSIVGIVRSVSEHFSVVMPVLHSKFQGSVKMKGSGDFGLLVWPGGDPEIANVKEIPKHVKVEIGDTVVTTGYSSKFPANIMVGYVESLDDRAEENFHRISIRLSTDFRKLDYVQVIDDLLKDEEDQLLEETEAADGANGN